MVGLDTLTVNLYYVGVQDRGLAFDVIDLVLAEQRCYSLCETVDDLATAGDARRVVGAHAFYGNAESRCVVHSVQHLCVVQERFGGDASPVQAHPAQRLALDAHGLQSELCGPDCGGVPPGTRANDRDIVVCHR